MLDHASSPRRGRAAAAGWHLGSGAASAARRSAVRSCPELSELSDPAVRSESLAQMAAACWASTVGAGSAQERGRKPGISAQLTPLVTRAHLWRGELEAKAAAAIFKIEFKKQSAHSPELNGLDLGFWYMLDCRVQAHYKEFEPYFSKMDDLLTKIYEVVEEEFWKILPEKIFSIFEHRLCSADTKPPASRAEPNRDRLLAGGVSFQRSYVRRSRSS